MDEIADEPRMVPKSGGARAELDRDGERNPGFEREEFLRIRMGGTRYQIRSDLKDRRKRE